jgi:SAM-dependent methyltransferase
VLDVAGGTGALAEALLPLVGSVTVSDISEAMLAHVPDGAETLVARAEQLPLPDESFDLVVCIHALHHIDRPVRAIDEMARVLAPGGRLVLEDFIADDDRNAALRWEEAERLRDPDHVRLLASGEARGAALAAGLTVEVEESWFETFEVDRWLAMADVGDDTAARVRELLGRSEVPVRAGRTRFRRPASVRQQS